MKFFQIQEPIQDKPAVSLGKKHLYPDLLNLVFYLFTTFGENYNTDTLQPTLSTLPPPNSAYLPTEITDNRTCSDNNERS
jgi:hypothetical protein